MSSRPDVGVVLVAAGRGTRAGGQVPKQFQPVAGVPMLLRALRPFASHPGVAHVAIVVPSGTVAAPPEWLVAATGVSATLVAGGARRAESVAAGLQALPPECTVVLVHDAARPFPPRDGIDAVIAAARAGASALLACPVTDTLKSAQGGGSTRVARTVPRDGLWGAQTPQGFPRAVLEEAHAAMGAETATDDAELVERTGQAVMLVPSTPLNLKVTAASDFALAEALLASGAVS